MPYCDVLSRLELEIERSERRG